MSGLTTAYLLSKDVSNQITVVAKHMPGDYDIEYCSPFAGANYLPYVFGCKIDDSMADHLESGNLVLPMRNGNVRLGRFLKN